MENIPHTLAFKFWFFVLFWHIVPDPDIRNQNASRVDNLEKKKKRVNNLVESMDSGEGFLLLEFSSAFKTLDYGPEQGLSLALVPVSLSTVPPEQWRAS